MDVVSIKTPFIIYVREGGREKKGGGGRPFSIVLAFFSAFFGKTSIFFRFFLKKNC